MAHYNLGLYEKSMPHKLSIAQKLATTKEIGFDFLEVSIDETDEKLSRLKWNTSQRAEVTTAINEFGIPIKTMCLSGHRKFPLGSADAATRASSLEIMDRAIDLACCWGVRIIQLAGYDVYYEDSNEKTLANFYENLSKSVDLAAKAGVMLAFETMETPFMDTVAKAVACVNKINSPYLHVYPDLGNLTNAASIYGHDVTHDIAAGRGHISAMHLKETKPGHYRDVPYGTGHVDFAAGIVAAQALGVNCFVGEFWDDGDYRPQMVHACRFLRGFFEDF